MKIINEYISVSDKANDQSGDIYIYGDIADKKWFDEDVTPKQILNALDSIGKIKNINIHINSYGGSCIAGNAIINIIDSYKRKNNSNVNVYIEGIAASMGSGIASCGDTVYMAKNSLYMIHKPLLMAYGNSEDLKKSIELLDKVEQTLVNNYMRKFKGTEDELRSMMEDETWLTADEAKEYGFVDEIVKEVKVAASAKGIKIGEQVFENKVADMIKNKYPNVKIEKEEKELTYDEKLKDYGIDEEKFTSLNIESEKVFELIDLIKPSINPEPIEDFISKELAMNELGCDEITAEEVLNYAKAGMHPVDTTEISEKANHYDKIVSDAKSAALVNAIKAQGDSYNESRMKKFLDVLSYEEIIEQDNAWKEEAKKSLNAGKRVSQRNSFDVKKEEENYSDYKF